MFRPLPILCLSLCAFPAFAQSVYVGASGGIDTTFSTQIEVSGEPQVERGGTTPVFAVRAGLPLGNRWGAEVEVAYALTLERTTERQFGVPDPPVFISTFPTRIIPTVSVETEQQLTAVNVAGWFGYPVNARIDLVFAAGMAFTRMTVEERQEFDFILPAGVRPPSIVFPFGPETTTIVSYDVAPLVGIEGRVRLGDRLRLVPALRLSGVPAGWSVRPTVGLDWTF